jgi:hypothetical protein
MRCSKIEYYVFLYLYHDWIPHLKSQSSSVVFVHHFTYMKRGRKGGQGREERRDRGEKGEREGGWKETARKRGRETGRVRQWINGSKR